MKFYGFLCSILFTVLALPLSAQLAGPRLLFDVEKPGNIRSVATADLDGDGLPDLIATFNNSIPGGWLRNLGDGRFAKPVFLEGLAATGSRAETGDIDGDGDTDIAVYAAAEGRVFWWANEGNGQFGTAQLMIDFISSSWWDFGLYDLDADGDLDLISFLGLFSNREVHWHANNGQGGFSYAGVLFDPLIPGAGFRVADLDGDQLPDVVALTTAYASWVRNLGGGEFSSPATLSDEVPNPGHYDVGDLDLDGDIDLLIQSVSERSLYVLWNDGSGQFAAPQVLAEPGVLEAEEYADAILIGELSGDTAPDVAVWLDGKVQWLENDGSGQLTAREMAFPQIGADDFSYMLADLNNDGRTDLLSADFSSIAWMENLGQGNWREGVSLYPQLGTFDIIATILAAADLDGDGSPDILSSSYSTHLLAWFPQESPGEYGELKTIFGATLGAGYIGAGDLDGDGDEDVLASTNDKREIHWLANDGSGSFGLSMAILDSINLYVAEIVDLNGDSKLDLLLKDGNSSSSVFWMPNDGDGQFGPPIFLSGGPLPNAYLANIADIDQDGDIDLISSSDSEGINWHPNDGAGNFTAAHEILSNLEDYYIAGIADIDNNGFPDLIIQGPGVLLWLANQGGETFEPPALVAPLPGAINGIAVLDLDGNQSLDVVFMSREGDVGLHQVLNDGTGQFGPGSFIHPLPSNSRIYAFDGDEDGDADLFYRSTHQIGWLTNLGGEAYISGYCFWDENGNGQQDSSELRLRGLTLELLPDASLAYTDEAGNFRFYVDPGAYELTFRPTKCWSLTTDSISYHIVFDGETQEYAFGFSLQDEAARTRASITSAPTRCGFTAPFWINLYNEGCGVPEGRFALAFDNSLLSLALAEPAPTTIAGDTLWWDYGFLEPGAIQTITLLCEVAGVEFLGDSIHLSGITYIANEEGQLLASDTALYASQINCAYDPNDKLVDIASIPFPVDTAQQLHYTVRFQNTGTDTAFTVRIRDTLDARLDWASLRPLGSSHPYEVSLGLHNGAVEFAFRNILLPDSTTNEPASHGFASFAIRLKEGLSEGAPVSNQAAIYFDFNPPIWTNTVESRVEQLVSTASPAPKPKLQALVFPNPTSGACTLRFSSPLEQLTTVQIIALDGKVTAEAALPMGTLEQELSLGHLPAGVYLLRARQGRVLYWLGSVARQ